MSLKTKSAADIQAIIDAALSKKPLLPKGLEEEIAQKQSAVAARKAAKADAAAKVAESDALAAKSIEKTLGKATTEKKVSKKAMHRKMKEQKEARTSKLNAKAAKKGAVAVQKKKRLDALQKLRLKEERKERRLAKRVAQDEEEEEAKKGRGDEDDEDFDSDVDGSVFDSSGDDSDDDTALNGDDTAAKQQKLVEKVLAKTIRGGADKDELAEDPLAATFGGAYFGLSAMRDSVEAADPIGAAATATASKKGGATAAGGLLHTLAQQKGSEYVPQESLLSDAHKFFSSLSETERKRNALARKKIAEMKAINKRGGDKDGFKFVLPSSVKSYARQLAGEGNDIPENLASHFLGDGVQDTQQAPSRKKEKKRYHDDFYSFQVAKKWTRNAENFLKKSTKTKNMFISRQQKLRTTKKM